MKKNENGWYSGQCEQIPEAISQGASIDELKENTADAIKMVLDYKQRENESNGLRAIMMKREIQNNKKILS